MIVLAKLKQPVARFAEGQRLWSRARRGEGGEGHVAIVTPSGRSGNVNQGRRAIRAERLCSLRASLLQRNGRK